MLGRKQNIMHQSRTRFGPRESRGSALIGVLFFMLIISVLLLGVGSFATMNQQRAKVDSNYAQAMDVTEAAVNKEFNRISISTSDGGSPSSKHTGTVGPGTYSAWCTGIDGTSNWVAPANLIVWATGTVNGTTRTIKVTGKGMNTLADYAVFAKVTGNINGTPNIYGSVGSNHQLNINGSPTITGTVALNGPGTIANINPPGRFTPQFNPDAVVWPTVDSIANASFPSGGLTWLSTHNDNATASPAIVGNSVLMNGVNNLTLVGKPGGANYYLTSLNLNGTSKVIFNNSLGPINVWFGPSGGAGTCNINGGTSSVKMSTDPALACKVYVASNATVNLNGNTELDAGIYAYNGASGGTVNFNGTGDIYGAVISNNFNFNGNPRVHYTPGYFNSGSGYYGFNDSWLEMNPR